MKKRRKVSLARRSKAVRIREQRGELRGWDADLGKVFDDNEDREALRKASTPNYEPDTWVQIDQLEVRK